MAQNASMEEFEALLNESLEMDTPDEGSVVKGKVIAVEAGQAIIDVGYKMEGRVELKEFANPGEAPDIAVGDANAPTISLPGGALSYTEGDGAIVIDVKRHGIASRRPTQTMPASKARSSAA